MIEVVTGMFSISLNYCLSILQYSNNLNNKRNLTSFSIQKITTKANRNLFLFYVDLKTPKHKYPFELEISMFSIWKTYVSDLRAVRFTDGKHTALVWET